MSTLTKLPPRPAIAQQVRRRKPADEVAALAARVDGHLKKMGLYS